MLTQQTIYAARKYVAGIRNRPKAMYAQTVMSYMLQWSQVRPEPPKDLSAMAAQAVRMQLASIIGDNGRSL